MKAEIIAVGTELLLGQILNTNAQYLSRALAELGIDVYFQTTVGDNPHRLKQALEISSSRADMTILTGGLGPTKDDLTKEVLAEFTERSLYLHEPSWQKIVDLFAHRARPLAENNKRQAMTLTDSDLLENTAGLAIGTALVHQGHAFIVLPGPPREMQVMFDNPATAWIRRFAGDQIPLHSLIWKFSGIGESSLAELVDDLIMNQDQVTLAPYANEGEVTLRISTKAKDEAEAYKIMEPTLSEIRRVASPYLFAESDITLEEAVVAVLGSKNQTLSSAESCTGGKLSDLMTNVPGSAAVFRGGMVTYATDVKKAVLGVSAELLEGEDAPGAVSRETAAAMAERALACFETDWALSFTGVAGDEPIEHHEAGTVYIGLASKTGEGTYVEEVRFHGNRKIVKRQACKRALHMLWLKIRPE